MLLSGAVERSAEKFPETYIAQVDSGDLIQAELETKLQKLLAFHASSPSIFSEIASLQQAVNQRLAQTKIAWNASTGTFTILNQEALSWTKGIQEKWQDYVEYNEPKIEVRVKKEDAANLGGINIL